MVAKKLLAGTLAIAMVASAVPAALVPADKVSAADTKEITIEKTITSQIGGVDKEGNDVYGGDPAILVDGDTVYLYTGHDVATSTGAYQITEWLSYSSKDLKNWEYHGPIMKADQKSITWANDSSSAWAAQVAKYGNKYYLYFCTWDKTSAGKQSIGVAVSDSPTGPFVDIGKPLVSGSFTTDETSAWNDIDPTVWIDKDEKGVEHRYLAWGNGKYYICELNEDMVSVKDIDGDGKVTFGKDVLSQKPVSANYTEAPWLYKHGDYYYVFYAYKFREEMAYSYMPVSDGLMSGKWTFGGVLTPPTATSDTNHMAVFDFNGKTYFVYHNGSLPGGSGQSRVPCIAEMSFNADGTINPIPETATGPFGTASKLYTSDGIALSHENYVNASDAASYPYTDVIVGTYIDVKADDKDDEWAIVAGKADKKKDSYVSIQSENKQGLYLTANDDGTVTLAQDHDMKAIAETAKKQTFRTVAGLADGEKGVSFESVYKEGMYITISGGSLVLTDGANAKAATFYVNEAPKTENNQPGTGTDTSIKTLTVNGTAAAAGSEVKVPFETKAVEVAYELTDEKAYVVYEGRKAESSGTITVPLSGKNLSVAFTVYASDAKTKQDYTVSATRENPSNMEAIDAKNLLRGFTFEDTTDGAVAVTKGLSPAAVSSPAYSYVEGRNGGKAINLTGAYGLKLCDTAGFGTSYTISFWMKPASLGGSVDPVLAAGTFAPEYWLNVTASGVGIWSHDAAGYINSAAPTHYFTVGEWQNVTLSVDGTQPGTEGESSVGKLYLNGELVQTGNVASKVMEKGGALYFGVNGWDAYFNGAIDELVVLKGAITEGQALALAYEGTDAAKLIAESPNGNGNNGSNTGEDKDDENNGSQEKQAVKKVVITKKGSSKAITKVSLKKGKSLKLAAKVTVTGGASKKVTWKTSNTKLAKVTSAGVVKAKKAGAVKITAVSKADSKKKCTIKVKVVN